MLDTLAQTVLHDGMTPQEFKEAILAVDALAEVGDHPHIRMAVKIRPSHPRYFDAVCKTAARMMPMGVLVAVAKEFDYFLTDDGLVPQPRGRSWWRIMREKLR